MAMSSGEETLGEVALISLNLLQATPDGGYAAVGYSYPNSFGNGDLTGINGKGGYDAIIVEYDSDGIMLWKQNFGGSDYDYFNSVIPAL